MMKRIHQRREGREGGFTLIELLIVIVILGILAAVVVFSVRGITDRGQTSACKATASSVITAAEAFRAQTGAYPATLNDLTTGANPFLNVSTATVTGAATATPTISGGGSGGWSLTFSMAAGSPPTITAQTPAGCAN